ncbi:MAG: trimethylamine methyltransferase family protein, partial [Candidatus Thorarchaeota archaeon]
MTNFKLLSKDDIENIHVSSLEILEKKGITVNNSHALQILADVGCSVESEIVKIPSDVISEFLEKAPKSFKLFSRDGNESTLIGGDNVIFNPGSSAIYITDRETSEIRKATSQDMVNLVQLVNNLEHIHAQSTAVVPTDVHNEISEWFRLYLILKNS